MKKVIGFLFVFCVAGAALDASEFRQWKDTRGNVIEAKLLKDNGNGTIHIQKSDGWRGDVPLTLLSAEDQEFVKTAGLASSLESAEPTLSTNFEVFRIRKEKVEGFVATGGGFELNVECIEAELRYLGSKAVEEVYVKAYFYDKDGKEIERFTRPPRTHDKSGKEIPMPSRFEPGDKYQVYFPISKVIADKGWRTVLVLYPVFFAIDAELGKLKWNWAVIVFQADESAAAGVLGPRGVAVSDFNFPGSEKIAVAEETQ